MKSKLVAVLELAVVAAVGQAATPVKVGVLCEAPFAIDTFETMKREGLGTFAALSVGPWTAEKLSAAAAFCRSNGYAYTMNEMTDRRFLGWKPSYRPHIEKLLPVLREEAKRPGYLGLPLMHEAGGVMFSWPANSVAKSFKVDANDPSTWKSAADGDDSALEPLWDHAQRRDVKTYSEANAHVKRVIGSYFSFVRENDLPGPFYATEPNFGMYAFLFRYGDYSRLCCELIYGRETERRFAGIVGATRAFGKDGYLCDVATAWYGGKQHDAQWRSRCRASFYMAFLRGADHVYAEHGIMDWKSLGDNFDGNHPLPKFYRSVVAELAAYAQANPRPDGLPETAIAAVQGRLDGFVGNWQTHQWGIRDNPRFLLGDPDRAWSIFDGLYRRSSWECRDGQGDVDYSGNPPLGMAEILPYDAPDKVLAGKSLLFFLGRNVMDDALYAKLVAYVRQGGRLLICASHLNTADEPDAPFKPYRDGDWSELLGVRCKPGEARMRFGIKFTENPPCGMKVNLFGRVMDPFFTDGGWNMPVLERCGAQVLAVDSCRFADYSLDTLKPVIFWNRIGKGCVVFVSSLDSPGAPGTRPLYEYLLARLVESVDVWPKVECSDRVRFSVYGGRKTVYLLNTEVNLSQEIRVRISAADPGRTIMLKAGEFRRLDF